ncbi:hypothetical protein CHLRE_06g310050v5 [Chlamydomonas reinhardtii]|uniref:CAAX prenyl protease 2/Lysostaphin resistance protein A-like domain-containing protein n=1 Tax=Chlamydomonas reinhardtii TaxID=3055 RepID=A0A2K3DRL1_CHLRE|nr:uncharacterized protein CHLRE_06g310050v5 [Chlamydomonas reinhardtii]PNW83179.1 hypothetical protein CHLRE_06g310050v5 [Chlamydomonas reinhardtii]
MQAIDLNLRISSTHRAQLAVLPRVGLHPVRGATRCRASTGPKSTLSGKSPIEQPARLWGRPGAVSSEPATSTSTQHRGGRPDGPDDDKPTWGVFDLARYGERWDVPWGAGRVAGGMALWFGSFVGVGFVLVPQLYRAAGVSLYDLPPEDKATFTLVCQAVETAVSLLLVRLLTAGPIARSGASEQQLGLFNFSPAAPFSKPRGWAFWGLCGVLASPAVVGGMASLLGAVGYEKAVGGQGTVDGVAGMIDLDLPTYLSLLAVTGVLAPILEETVFRGFLLTSLTRFMPTWAAVVASSGFFGLAHLSPRDLPVLSALGLLLGWSYVRSRNLLTPILIHGAWNSGVLTVLFWLASEGVDVQQLISDLREAAAAAS